MNQSPNPPLPAGGTPTSPAPETTRIPLRIDAGWAKDVGKARDHNEDAVYGPPPGLPQAGARGYLFMIADGMGGHNAGEVASNEAVRLISTRYYTDTNPDVHRSLDAIIRQTNAELHYQAQANPMQHGMGTTLVAAVVRDNHVFIAHVGDSRLYLVRNGAAEQITQDHSWVDEQVRAGILTRQQAESHPQRNVITRALASNPDVRVDHLDLDPLSGDVLVLCSDGLSTEVAMSQIAILATKGSTAQEAVQKLIQAANDNGGNDNISCIVIRLKEQAPAAPPAPIIAAVAESSPEDATPTRVLPRVGSRPVLMLALLGLVVFAAAGGFLLVRRSLQSPSVIGRSQASPTAAQVTVIPSVPHASPTTVPRGATAGGVVGITPTLGSTNGGSTATLAPSATPLTPSSTLTVRAASTVAASGQATRTGSAGSNNNRTSRPAPVLKSPADVQNGPSVDFVWEPTGGALAPSEAFALFVWPEGQLSGATGWSLPTLDDACNKPVRQSRFLADNFHVLHPVGAYLWTVVVIDTSRRLAGGKCEIVSDQPAPLRFNYGYQISPTSQSTAAAPTETPTNQPTPTSPADTPTPITR